RLDPLEVSFPHAGALEYLAYQTQGLGQLVGQAADGDQVAVLGTGDADAGTELLQLVAELGLGQAHRALTQHAGGEAGEPKFSLALGTHATRQGDHDGDGRDLVTLGTYDLDVLVELAVPDGRYL